MLKILLFFSLSFFLFAQESDTLNISSDSLSVELKIIADENSEINIKPISFNSSFVTSDLIKFNEYNYLGNHLSFIPFSVSNYSGFFGLPHEFSINGLPLSQTSVLQSGIEMNSRFNSGFDIHLPHLEQIDSIEIIPSYKSFMFGSRNQSASFNLIMKDKFRLIPYSRLKYYEGVAGESFLDVFLSNQFYKKFQISVAVNSWKVDDSYSNSEANLWNLTAKGRYLISNNFNILFTYNFVDKKTSYNGGADYDSIKTHYSNTNLVLYDEISSPVVFLDDNFRNKSHNYFLNIFYNPFSFNENEISFYSKTNNYYYIQNENNLDRRYSNSYFEYDELLKGVQVASTINFHPFSLKGRGGIEEFEYRSGLIQKNNLKYLSGELSTNFFDSLIQTSFFTKVLFYEGKIFPGSGGEIHSRINENISFYAGLSYYRNSFINTGLNEDNNIFSLEGGIKLNIENIYSSLSLFSRDKNLYSISGNPVLREEQISGINLVFNYKLFDFFIETKTQYYHVNNFKPLPQFYSELSIFYKDYLFNDNLLLKAGFRNKFYGEQTFFNYNHFTGAKSFDLKENIPFAYQIDFVVSGEIQKVVMVYFSWNNLTNSEYFLIPYYPMPLRSIRFGIAWEFFN